MIRVNGVAEEFRDETIEALIERHGIDARGIAVALDGEIVRRSLWSSTLARDGSQVEIVTAAAGG